MTYIASRASCDAKHDACFCLEAFVLASVKIVERLCVVYVVLPTWTDKRAWIGPLHSLNMKTIILAILFEIAGRSKLSCTAHDCANMFSGPTGSCVRDGRPWASSRCQTILSCTKFLILRIKNELIMKYFLSKTQEV